MNKFSTKFFGKAFSIKYFQRVTTNYGIFFEWNVPNNLSDLQSFTKQRLWFSYEAAHCDKSSISDFKEILTL